MMSRNSVIVQEKEVNVINQELDLSDLNISSISDINGLDKLDIQTLTLKNNNIADINDLPNLPNLSILSLSGNQICKIEGLANLKKLEVLDLSGNQIRKIEDLDPLQNLRKLNLSGNQICKIEGLANLKLLEVLDLSGNQIRKIEDLDPLQNLLELSLSGNQICIIEGLANLKLLEVLDLSSNQISKIQGLSSQNNLLFLLLSINKIKRLENLANLTLLAHLDLSGNQIQIIEGLNNLRNLQDLDLSKNKIQSIQRLNHLENLQVLNLKGNQIQTIENLHYLVKLGVLNLCENSIQEIQGLDLCKKLHIINLNNNPIKYLDRDYINESAHKIKEHCRNKKDNPNFRVEIINKYYDNVKNNLISDKEIYNIGTYREDRGLKEVQNLVFLEKKLNPIILTENGSLKKSNIYMIQLHEIPNEYGFQPTQSKMAHFETFANTFWDIDEGALRYKKHEKLTATENKLQKMLMQIFRDEGENKIIIFPENSVPFDTIEVIKEMVNKQSQKNQNHIVIVGGCEHIKKTTPIEQGESLDSNKYRFLKNRRIKNFDPETFEGFKKDSSKPINGYLNQAFIIDGNKLGWQMKQTPVVLHDKDRNEELREPIDCIKEPDINIFETSLGRIAIFICKDFLRFEQIVVEWGKRNKVNFIVVPSNTSKVLPFIYRLHRILNEEYQPTIQIIYANVGEYGGSELFSIDVLPKIEKSYQRNHRDNVGEVIVKRIFDPDCGKK
jgi:Leucine-rich repeat (LRR) protein/predicted amidohydrolase